MIDRHQFHATVDEINDALRCLTDIGWQGFDCSPETIDILEGWGKRPRLETESLDQIRRDLGDCSRCGLCQGRTHIVYGTGNPSARLVFVGEGPGRDEDLQGEPFVGKAGQLLTKIIEAMQLTRDEVYICNIIKCRPPNNRDPQPDEIEACAPFLRRQIVSVQPEFICTLGAFATRTLLQNEAPMWKLRGHFHEFMGIPLMPTYHPAFLLRTPEKKRETWADIQQLMKAMNEKMS
jgi:uracil-DNA glycosylase